MFVVKGVKMSNGPLLIFEFIDIIFLIACLTGAIIIGAGMLLSRVLIKIEDCDGSTLAMI